MPKATRIRFPSFLSLFTKTVAIVLVAGLATELVVHLLPTRFDDGSLRQSVLESVILVAVYAPLLWFVVVRPLGASVWREHYRTEAILAEFVDAVMTVDAAGVVQSCNSATEAMFGARCEDLIGLAVTDLFVDGESIQQRCELLCEARDMSHFPSLEAIGRKAGDGRFPLEVSISRIRVEGAAIFLFIMRDISERKQSEASRLRLVSLLEATLESTADGIIVVDQNFKAIAYNRKFLELWGLSPELLERGDWEQVFAHMEPLLVDPDLFRSRLLEIGSQNDKMELDIVYLTDGRIFERYSQPQKIEGIMVGRVSSYRDITERIKTVQALVASEARFRQIFEQTVNALCIFDASLERTLDLNPSALSLFREDKDVLMRMPPAHFFAETSFPQVAQQLDQPGSDGFWIESMDYRNGEGKCLTLAAHGKRIELNGQPVVLCTFSDISDKVQMEEQIRAIQAKLIQANKMTSLGELVTGIAHEINNPNNYIMISAELLSRTWADARPILDEYQHEHGDFSLGGMSYVNAQGDIQELLGSLLDGSRRIRDIINSLKDFAREGKAGVHCDVDINQVVTKATTIISHQINRYTGKFTLTTAPDIPPVCGNLHQLEQVLINLILNAIQSLPDQGRAIDVATRYDVSTGMVRVEVTDEGVGIPADIADKVFQPFFTTRLDNGGTGLGLSISQAIVRDHNGSIRFESVPGQGTTFILELPAITKTS